ncbi:hypothetical protein [Flexilinea flocculi]|uniref:Uncharacterized protein n=1 Tax=Flexilinea flocculi TaxID=1678840 RepID=A0A0S7BX20_9CHLR|nr:hypothetical protein [Flexilinea flocculi]NLI41271.1 hypothetical protein [Caldisericales bacterium]GAP41144.1 hypothetical protein ATC1_131126 [Flexilinea flocculi]
MFDPTEIFFISEESDDYFSRELFAVGDSVIVVAPNGANFRKQLSYAYEDVISSEFSGFELKIKGEAVEYGVFHGDQSQK